MIRRCAPSFVCVALSFQLEVLLSGIMHDRLHRAGVSQTLKKNVPPPRLSWIFLFFPSHFFCHLHTLVCFSTPSSSSPPTTPFLYPPLSPSWVLPLYLRCNSTCFTALPLKNQLVALTASSSNDDQSRTHRVHGLLSRRHRIV